ncbi:MAG: stage II sporulation protein P [Flavonifractor plautii]
MPWWETTAPSISWSARRTGKKVAQVMLVVGTDGGGAAHPYWIDNLALAIRYQQELVSDYVSLARPIVLRNSRYNQQPVHRLFAGAVEGRTRKYTHRGLGRARLFAQSVSQVLVPCG